MKRTAFIAACLCLLLAGTVLAVEVVCGISLRNIVSNRNYSSYSIWAEIEPWTMTQFSQSLQDDFSAGQSFRTHEDWQSAANYLGLPLLRNSLLESLNRPTIPNANYIVTAYPIETSAQDTQAWPEQIRVLYSRVVDHIQIDVKIVSYTEHADLSKAFPGLRWRWKKDFQSENYPMANGCTANIITVSEPDRTPHYLAYFVHDNVLYEVSARWRAGHTQAKDLYAFTKQILDNFK